MLQVSLTDLLSMFFISFYIVTVLYSAVTVDLDLWCGYVITHILFYVYDLIYYCNEILALIVL